MGGLAIQYPKIPETKKNSPLRIQRTKSSQSMKTPADRILFLQRTIGNQAVQRLIKSGTLQAKNIFKKYPDIKKQLWGGHFRSDGGYIGTVGDGVTTDIIKRYVETQGTKEEKEGCKQMKLLEFK